MFWPQLYVTATPCHPPRLNHAIFRPHLSQFLHHPLHVLFAINALINNCTETPHRMRRINYDRASSRLVNVVSNQLRQSQRQGDRSTVAAAAAVTSTSMKHDSRQLDDIHHGHKNEGFSLQRTTCDSMACEFSQNACKMIESKVNGLFNPRLVEQLLNCKPRVKRSSSFTFYLFTRII